MHIDLMYPSKFVKCADLLGKPAVVTIASVKLDEIQTVDGKKSKKAVVTFEKTEKAWVMNKTCAKVIKKTYGAETNNWIGKRIELYPTTCEAFGEIVDCVRVRVPVNGKTNGKAKPAPVDEQMDPVTGVFPDTVQPAQPEENWDNAQPPADQREPGGD